MRRRHWVLALLLVLLFLALLVVLPPRAHRPIPDPGDFTEGPSLRGSSQYILFTDIQHGEHFTVYEETGRLGAQATFVYGHMRRAEMWNLEGETVMQLDQWEGQYASEAIAEILGWPWTPRPAPLATERQLRTLERVEAQPFRAGPTEPARHEEGDLDE